MAKSLLETGENGGLVAGLDIDHPSGWQAGLGQGGREEVLPRDTPQDAPLRSGSDAGGPEGRGRAVDGAVCAPRARKHPPHGPPATPPPPHELMDAKG